MNVMSSDTDTATNVSVSSGIDAAVNVNVCERKCAALRREMAAERELMGEEVLLMVQQLSKEATRASRENARLRLALEKAERGGGSARVNVEALDEDDFGGGQDTLRAAKQQPAASSSGPARGAAALARWKWAGAKVETAAKSTHTNGVAVETTLRLMRMHASFSRLDLKTKADAAHATPAQERLLVAAAALKAASSTATEEASSNLVTGRIRLPPGGTRTLSAAPRAPPAYDPATDAPPFVPPAVSFTAFKPSEAARQPTRRRTNAVQPQEVDLSLSGGSSRRGDVLIESRATQTSESSVARTGTRRATGRQSVCCLLIVLVHLTIIVLATAFLLQEL